KPIDSAGKVFNNVGGRIGRTVAEKLNFIRPYKFTIAFENESHPGYTTEKIYEPMLVNSLPIYWGDPLVHRDFNPASFLSFYDYGDQDALIDRVIEVDRNDELYLNYLQQPWLPPGADEQAERQAVLAQFDHIFSTSKTPVAKEPRSMRHYFIHPPRRASIKLGQKTVRLGRKIRYRLDLVGFYTAAKFSWPHRIAQPHSV